MNVATVEKAAAATAALMLAGSDLATPVSRSAPKF